MKSTYNRIIKRTTGITINESLEGETIEMKIERILNNGEPITDGAPIIFTERKHGVQPDYNIRTDRFDVAIEAMDKVNRSHRARRMENMKIVTKNDTNKDVGNEPIQATE